MENPLISIIIPVYNIEKYLNECIESVLNQTFDNYEIVLVDDGSTDKSGSICDNLSLRNPKIKTYHKRNGGLSSARNYGIKHSKGKYVIFLDSDDYWLNKDILSLFVRKAEEDNLDVVRGEYLDVDEKRNIQSIPDISEKDVFKDKVLSPFEMVKFIINGRFFPWLFFYKRESLGDLLFDEKRKFQEDIDFEIRFFSKNVRCGYIPVHFYAYRHRENSIISTPRLINVTDSFSLTDIFYEFAHQVKDKRLSELYLYNGIMMYYWTLETVASDLYISRYHEIDKLVKLQDLQKKVHHWISEFPQGHYPIHLYVKPYIGVRIFRIRWFIGRVLRKMHIYKFLKASSKA